MRTDKLGVWACGLVLFICARAVPGPESAEPPELFLLELGEQRVPVRLGRSFDVEIDGKSVTMKLHVKPYRVFEAAGVRFRYPRHFTFECEKDDGATTWTLAGLPNTVLILVLAARQDPAEWRQTMAQELLKEYGSPSTDGSDVELELAQRRLKGSRVAFRLEGRPFHQDIYAFHTGKGTCALIIQDTLTDKGARTADTKAVVTLLQQTFEVTDD